jgi:hypothetical protein
MSPTLHRRDTVNEIIQAMVQKHHPTLEIRLTPNRIPSGKGDNKRYTTAVEVQVDRQHLQKARELMIEIFESKRADLPKDIFFVPSPTNGTMPYELFYQNLQAHHEHVANLRCFAITNVGNLKAEMTFTDPTGMAPTRITTFEEEIMREQQEGTAKKLFYSIEPTKFSATEGRYLLVTHKDNIAEAEKFIDYALTHLTNTCPDNMTKIMRSQAPVTRANRIHTSERFQSYVTKLQGMIPSSIHTSTPTENVWKRRTPTAVNLTDDHFPTLESPKKPRTDPVYPNDNATATDTTESLTMIDLDEIEKHQTEITATLRQELETLRAETQQMQVTLQNQFNTAMNNLEIRIEKSNQTMFHDLNQALHKAVETMNSQAALADTLLQNFKDEATKQHATLLHSITNQIAALRPNKRDRNDQTTLDDIDENEMVDHGDPYHDLQFGDQNYTTNSTLTGTQLWAQDSPRVTTAQMDNNMANGSQNPAFARRASPPNNGKDASTGGIN